MERNSRLPVGWVQRSSVEGGSLGGFRVLRRERRQLEIRLGFGGDEHRVERIAEWLPEAERAYKPVEGS
jgi:hypothetical protein